MERKDNLSAALESLPERLRKTIGALPKELLDETLEIRLRAGRPLMLCGSYGVCFPDGHGRYSRLCPVKTPEPTAEEIGLIVQALAGHSVYSHTDELNSGFVTSADGMRAGVAGCAGTSDGKVRAVRDIRSVNIRIARNVDGAAQPLCERIFADGLKNVVLYGAPLCGKTTMLKDIARILSSGPYYYRTAVADERRELSAAGGVNIDFFTGYPKKNGIEYAVRSFSPDVILCDELGTDEECAEVLRALGCGVRFVLSVHCGSRDELLRRPLCHALVDCGAFDYFVFLPGVGKDCEIFSGEELYDESRGVYPDPALVPSDRSDGQRASFAQGGVS
ncbi:MAG: hypothetical protein IJL26_13705 [Clostridia bacterium]|nr:hypothetical protein [Clostridia bacterium]